jgi:hypothetical protein
MLNDVELLNSPELMGTYCKTLEVCGVDSVWLGEHLTAADRYRPGFPALAGKPAMRPTEPARSEPAVLGRCSCPLDQPTLRC